MGCPLCVAESARLPGSGRDLGQFFQRYLDLCFFGFIVWQFLSVKGDEPVPQRDIFWEMGQQTAVRRGPWKLVLNGQLVEGALPEDDVHLANLEVDMAERHNLKDRHPDLAAELAAAGAWRVAIEERWQREWLSQVRGTTTHPGA